MNQPSNFIDLSGNQYDGFTVIRKGGGRYTSGGQYKTTWICKCDYCGSEFEADSQSIRRNSIKSCGCMRYNKVSNSKRLKLEGKRFGRLIVVKWIPFEERKNKKKYGFVNVTVAISLKSKPANYKPDILNLADV